MVQSSISPIQDALRLTLAGEVSVREKASGLTSEFPLPGVALKGVALHDGALTIELEDPQHKTSGGACRASVLRAQIEATAKQFPEVTSVRFIPDTLFQP